MTAFRCTAKLLKAIKATPVAVPEPATNRLGDWTANLLRVSRIQLVLAVSERTRMGVVIDAAPYATVPVRLAQALFKALLVLDVPADMAAAEADSIASAPLAKSNSSSVLGTLNQYAVQIESALWHGQVCSARELTEQLAGMVVIDPKHIGFPADRVREAFGLPPIDRRRPSVATWPPGSTLH